MVNLKEFENNLIKENKSGLAELKCDGKTNIVNFFRFEDAFFIFPACHIELIKGEREISEHITDIRNDKYRFGDNRVYFCDDVVEDEIDKHINDYILPMVVDDVLYEIDSPQCPLQFQEEVESIRMIDEEREALLLLIALENNEKTIIKRDAIVWKPNKDMKVIYSEPCITGYSEEDNKTIEDINGAMYFYYNIEIFNGENSIFEADTYDFPKIQDLPISIDYIIDRNDEDMYLVGDYKHDNGFSRRGFYSYVEIKDPFDMEYSYRIDKRVTYVKQSNESEETKTIYYDVQIAKPLKNEENDTLESKEIVSIEWLEEDDLLKLKDVANEFCEKSIEHYNRMIATNKLIEMKDKEAK